MRSLPLLFAALVACAPGTMDPDSDGGRRRDGGTPSGDGSTPRPGEDGAVTPGEDGSVTPGEDGGTTTPGGCDPACGTGQVCRAGRCEDGLTGVDGIDDVLLGDPTRFDTEVLISQDPDMSWRPSTIYKWRDFGQAVATMFESGIGEMHLWLGDEDASDEVRTRQALVNLAAFLAQAMKETIKYDACDENNWDATNNYAISNACGQLGQDYGSYDCEMACPRNPAGAMTAVTHAKWYGAPGPLFCAPNATLQAAGLMRDGRTGRWNYGHDCYPYPATEAGFSTPDAPAWSRAECEVYAGQRAGRWEWDGSGGSVEDCCWWGRGVIQTTGRCNFGMLNHYLGRSHLDAGRFPRSGSPLYPDLDFCADPESICSSTAHPELKWIAGLFYWMSSVEAYDRDGWSYRTALREYVAGGLAGNAFIDAVSGIVNRGCHNPPCATGPVDGLDDRRANFETVLRTMGLR
ncbi:MAG: hypothetical protein H6724_14745 [Sandaracinus sp.]|nr:hypothetical protein [Sandaracinus sp.]